MLQSLSATTPVICHYSSHRLYMLFVSSNLFLSLDLFVLPTLFVSSAFFVQPKTSRRHPLFVSLVTVLTLFYCSMCSIENIVAFFTSLIFLTMWFLISIFFLNKYILGKIYQISLMQRDELSLSLIENFLECRFFEK